MNIKLQLGEVRLLIDKRFPIEQISKQLQPLAEQANLIFAEHQVGAGYLQWTLPGYDWTAFTTGDDSQKSVVAQLYKERKTQMQSALQGSFLKDVVFSVPSEDYIFFRENNDKLEIALTAWGYKYPNKPASGELDTWLSKQELQKVNIAFAWADQTLPSFSFKLSGHTRTTSPDGFMHVDGLLPVGSSYSIETLMGQGYTLVVEKGKSDYIFDLTQYCQVEIAVYKDNNPLQDSLCEIDFGGNHKTLTTDLSGRIQLKLPLINDSFGQIVIPQPPCVVVCGADTQQQIPIKDGDVLNFLFNFKTEKPQPPIVEPPLVPDKHIHIKVEVFRGNKPVSNQPSEVVYNGDSHIINTDENGEAFFDIITRASDLDAQERTTHVCEVICSEARQSRQIGTDTTNLIFHFDLPQEDMPKESKYVYIQLNDYAGMPLIDIPFNLTTKAKGKIQLRTDDIGKCKIPQEWFTPKEKMKIEFTVSPEYQATHDIHYPKSKSKK